MERAALSDLMAEYGMALDEDRLEDGVELFEEQCDYRVVTRENVAQGLPNVLMWCDNKNMLRDRVESYRHVNEYNPHYDRHVIGPVRDLAHRVTESPIRGFWSYWAELMGVEAPGGIR